MSIPKISVVMPAYNAEKYIAEAIDSILNQTYRDFEFIIINDGSIDKTEEIILSYKDERIVYLKNEKNMGIVYTLNRGLDAAKGEYIARMDSDDISLPTRFEEQIDYLIKHNDIAVLGTAINIFGENIDANTQFFPTNPREAKAGLFFSSSLAHPTVIIKKSILDKYNLQYEEEYAGMEDFVFWWRIAQFADISSLHKPLLRYRRHASQITAAASPQKLEKAKKFLLSRLEVFDVDFSKAELCALEKYCMGSCKFITNSDIENLIIFYKKLLQSNIKIKYFCQHQFKQELCSSIIYYINSSPCSRNEKLNFYIFAFKNKVLPFILFLKLLARLYFKS